MNDSCFIVYSNFERSLFPRFLEFFLLPAKSEVYFSTELEGIPEKSLRNSHHPLSPMQFFDSDKMNYFPASKLVSSHSFTSNYGFVEYVIDTYEKL